MKLFFLSRMCVLVVAPVLAGDPATLSTTRSEATEAAAIDTSALLIPPDPYCLKNVFARSLLGMPVQLLYPPDDPDGILVVCRQGKVYRLSKSANAALPETFLDLSDRVRGSDSRYDAEGMLGIAFHPQYSRNRKLFVSYSVDPEYGQAARVFDFLTVVMLLIGIALGIGCRRYRKLSASHEVIAIFYCAIFVAFLLTPTDVEGPQKKQWAMSIFAAVASLGYLVLWLGNSKFATAKIGAILSKIISASCGAGSAVFLHMLLTLVLASSLDASSGDSVLTSHAVAAQSKVLHRVRGMLPSRLAQLLQVPFPTKSQVVIAQLTLRKGSVEEFDPEREVLRISFAGGTHLSGSLEFGPDGFLYIAVGEGGRSDRNLVQKKQPLYGAILRINIDRTDSGSAFSIPEDNPFVDAGGRGEIWAYGFRNIWRLAIDRTNGDLLATDTGESSFEEVNIVQRGGNYGWPQQEGTSAHSVDVESPNFASKSVASPTKVLQQQSTLIDPVVQYGHSVGLAVIGGRVYRGRKLPDLVGQYVFGDFASGVIWSLDLSGVKPRTRRIAIGNIKITAIGEDSDGELYVLAANGRVLQLAAAPHRSKPFPATLSTTGLFESTSDLRPIRGAVQYDVNVPLWSDGTSKNRFFALPELNSVGYSADGNWRFPVGTVFVKTFMADPESDRAGALPEVRLETRLLVNGPAGWHGYVYQWDESQRDAHLINRPDPTEPPRSTIEHFSDRQLLNRGQCNWCHTPENGFQLGLLSAQLNRPFLQDGKSINQIAAMSEMGIFIEAPAEIDYPNAWPCLTDQNVNIEKRARCYLNVNCATCHSPLGLFSLMDLRNTTPLDQTELLTKKTLATRTGKQGFRHAILPGHPEKSELIRRMLAVDGDRMPPTGNSAPDAQAIEVLSEWVRGMHESR